MMANPRVPGMPLVELLDGFAPTESLPPIAVCDI